MRSDIENENTIDSRREHVGATCDGCMADGSGYKREHKDKARI